VPTTSTVTSIEFRDTGVKLTVEPSIRLGGELGLKMKIEVVRLGDQVILQASPPITQFKFGNRSAETMLSIKNGETIILGGLLQEEDRKTRVTVPWLGDLPLIGNLISSFKTQRVTTEVILTITPHIVQTMTAPALNTQAFWSGTESTYATSPMFSTPTRQVSMSLGSGQGGSTSSTNGVATKATEQTNPGRSLSQLATPGPILAVQPEESAVQAGRDVKLAIIDGRLRATEQNVFRVEFDPKILQFKQIGQAELIGAPDSSTGSNGDQSGAITFKLARPSQRAPRSVNVTFVAKAPGVSPVRVELADTAAVGQVASSDIGTGVVRVR
jgi:general secretion pathway protein D